MTDDLPESIIIAGAGAIGVEFAYVMANYGVQVTIVEFLDRMVPLEEPEVSAELAKAYKKLGVTVLHRDQGRGDRRLRRQGQGHRLPGQGRRLKVLEADKVMQAIGFAPRTQGYGLDKTGVELTERGAIAIDDYMRTNVPHIYAIGDCTAKLMLAHTAEAQGDRRRRDDRRRGDHADRLRHDPAGDLLPAADRLLRILRGRRPRRRATTSRPRSSRSAPTARRTGSATRPASSSWWPTPSTARSSACT